MGQSLTPARVRFSADFNVFHPGAVLQGQESPILLHSKPDDTLYLGNQLLDLSKTTVLQPQMNPLSDRLDGMAAEIKELRKVVEEPGKVLKDRK